MSTTTPASTPPAAIDGRQARRQARVQAIRDGARVRQALGQGALHDHVDGEHVVVCQGERYIGHTIDAAIRVAREGGE